MLVRQICGWTLPTKSPQIIVMMPMPLIGRALTFRSSQQSRLIEWRFADIGLVENELKPLENEAFEQMAN
jgi:hypothetical protein